ncbi:uncharacterized protein EV422DRAFT_325244 [Fimicolochytrium jonesii]|uniref:uncharacterized protein n=1 Tax=Fimicolochytrium jonesii TaxID=1396493 RepID=UPI0022FE3A8F|nr:uncharacterized protein EV422DRAFT_325244 [Fimicolochytrium jonesii]KAI8824557.1 hypothetical protein EV422DRAFT_325244 [Fimicolochytrium jonesii]
MRRLRRSAAEDQLSRLVMAALEGLLMCTRKRDDEDDEHDERAPRKRQLRTRDVTPPISHDVEDGEEIDDDDDEPRPLKLRSSRTTAASSGSPAAKRKAVPRKPTQSIFNAMPDAPDIDNDETDGDDPHVTKEGFIAESRMDPKLMAKRSWEDDIDHVDTIERAGIGLCVYLVWKSGLKSVHPTPTANKKCPQKLLAFYESHLKFTPPANPSSSSSPSNGGDQLETHGALALTQPPNSDPEAEENDTTITTTETTTTHFRVATISTNNTLPPSPSGDIRRLFDELAEADAGLSTASRNHNEDEEEEEGLPEGYETQRGRGAGIYGHLF